MNRRRFLTSLLAIPALPAIAEAVPQITPAPKKLHHKLKVYWLKLTNMQSFDVNRIVFEKAGHLANFSYPECMCDLRDACGVSATLEMVQLMEYQLNYGDFLLPWPNSENVQMPPKRVEVTRLERMMMSLIISDFRYRGLTCEKLFSLSRQLKDRVPVLDPITEYAKFRDGVLGQEAVKIKSF